MNQNKEQRMVYINNYLNKRLQLKMNHLAIKN